MKKFLLIITALFFTVLVNATPVLEIEHSTYQPQETLFATISTEGSFSEELNKDDITFYEGRKQVFFEHNLYQYNETYYLDVVFNREGIFTIKTPEILFTLAGEVGSRTLEETVSVYYDNYNNLTNTYTDVLSIKPGIIYTLANKSELKLFNRGTNQLDINIGDISISIAGLQAQTISLNLEKPLTFVSLSTYKTFSVPIIYLGSASSIPTDNQTTIEIKETKLQINTKGIEIITQPNKSITKIIKLENLGNNEITNMKILNNITTATINIPTIISPNSIEELSITIKSQYESFVDDILILNYIENGTEHNKTIPITIYISKENATEVPTVTEGTCSELNGDLCDGECDGDTKFTTDGYCCFGKCIEYQIAPPSSSSNGASYQWIAGLLLFIILGVIGYFIYKKYNKTKPESPDKKLDISKNKYEDRLKGKVKDKVTRH